MSIDDFIIDRIYQKITDRISDGFERSCYLEIELFDEPPLVLKPAPRMGRDSH